MYELVFEVWNNDYSHMRIERIFFLSAANAVNWAVGNGSLCVDARPLHIINTFTGEVVWDND